MPDVAPSSTISNIARSTLRMYHAARSSIPAATAQPVGAYQAALDGSVHERIHLEDRTSKLFLAGHEPAEEAIPGLDQPLRGQLVGDIEAI